MRSPLYRWLILCVVITGAARCEMPPLLKEALINAGRESDFWAYTETTTVRMQGGKSRSRAPMVTIVRFDPSKPYPEQFTPLQVNGKPPTARALKRYRERGENRGRLLERAVNAAPDEGKDSIRKFVDIDHITATEDGGAVVYLFPLHKGEFRGIPMDKFALSLRVIKERRALESISVQLRDSMRVKLLAKIKSGEFTADYATVDPKCAPLMTAIRGSMAFSFMFVRRDAVMEQSRTEFKRVTPYRDRFNVEVGPLKVLEFL